MIEKERRSSDEGVLENYIPQDDSYRGVAVGSHISHPGLETECKWSWARFEIAKVAEKGSFGHLVVLGA